jgi:hypothetical protein
LDRLLAGLTKAGLPDLPLGYHWNSGDRLTGDEIRSLVFGHEFRGRQVKTGEPYARNTAADGTARLMVGMSPRTGSSRIEGDFLCTVWDTRVERTCAAIFRNQNGTPEMQNEYILLVPDDGSEFSVVK